MKTVNFFIIFNYQFIYIQLIFSYLNIKIHKF